MVNVLADFFKVAVEVLPRAAVAVPVGVVKLHEAGATLDETAGEEAVRGEGGFVGFDAVAVEGALGFTGEIHELGGAGLHAVGHLVGVEAGQDFGVAGLLEAGAVEGADGVVEATLAFAGNAFGAAEVEDGVALSSEGNALKGGWEEAAGPERIAGAGAAWSALEDDKAGKVFGFAAEAVGDPRAHAGSAGGLKAGVHKELGGSVIEDVGRHAAQPDDFVDDLAVVWKEFADRHPALSVALELALTAEEGFVALEEGEALALHKAFGRSLAVVFAELGLVLEEVELAGGSGHVEENDVLGLCRKGWFAGAHRIGRIDGGKFTGLQLPEHGVNGDGAEADSAVTEEVAAGALGEPAIFEVVHGDVTRG